MIDHRADTAREREVQYGPAHAVSLIPGGVLAGLAGTTKVTVNSLHSQAIDRLGHGLTAEAVAPDGLIEAVSVDHARAFAVAVQWHPEWRVMDNPFSLAMFQAFGDAARTRAEARDRPALQGRVA